MNQPNLIWKAMRAACRLTCTVAFDLKVYGRKNVPQTGGVLLVSNHQSFLDPIVIGVHLTRPMSYMARSGLFDNKYFGWLIRNLYAFPVRQGEGDVGAVRETIRRLQEGHMLNIFPEGARSEDGKLQKIQTGVALVVRKAAVPVVPVGIEGSFQAWPRGRKVFRRHPVRVIYGKPMRLHDLKSGEIVQRIERELRTLIHELHEKDRRQREAGHE